MIKCNDDCIFKREGGCPVKELMQRLIVAAGARGADVSVACDGSKVRPRIIRTSKTVLGANRSKSINWKTAAKYSPVLSGEWSIKPPAKCSSCASRNSCVSWYIAKSLAGLFSALWPYLSGTITFSCRGPGKVVVIDSRKRWKYDTGVKRL